MVKKYIVRLSEEERGLLGDMVKKLKGTSQKVRRASNEVLFWLPSEKSFNRKSTN